MKIRAFLEKKGVTLSPKKYFIDAMSSLALGLFASLLIGTIFDTLATYLAKVSVLSGVAKSIDLMASYATGATGAVLGIAVAHSLQAPPLVLFSAGAVGLCGNGLIIGAMEKGAGPAGAFLCTLIAVELGKLVSKETKVDILVTPVVTIGSGILVAQLICPIVGYIMSFLGNFINQSTMAAPFFMGIILSVVVGIVLTLPISSAALCAMIGISGLAGGAATAGCCAQMVGFAVISFRENRFSGLVAQGLGTSMLQMGNIVKKPQIWIPPTLAAAVVGPIATCLFKLECTGVSAGMGTCGLVGPLGILDAMHFSGNAWLGVLIVCIVLPAILSFVFNEIMRKMGWIKTGDMKLDL